MSSTSDTINIKGNRKVVCATYYAPESVFKIPDGLDLEDKSVVKFWGVKYNTLYIHYVDGHEEELEPTLNALDSSDYKHPQETEIEDADDCSVDYSEDEDEEDYQKLYEDALKQRKKLEEERVQLRSANQKLEEEYVQLRSANQKLEEEQGAARFDRDSESVTNKCDECKQSHPMCSRWRHEDRLCVKCCECENCLSLIERTQ